MKDKGKTTGNFLSLFRGTGAKDKKLTDEQKAFITKAIKDGFSVDQTTVIRDGFREELPIEQMQIVAHKEFHWKQMIQLYLCFKEGMTIECVLPIAKVSTSANDMCAYRMGIRMGVIDPEIDIETAWINHDIEATVQEAEEIVTEENTKPMEQEVEEQEQPPEASQKIPLVPEQKQQKRSERFLIDPNRRARKLMQVKSVPPTDDEPPVMIYDGLSDEQIKQVLYGFIKDGLTIDQVRIYADQKYNAAQMQEIRYGFKDGLSVRQILMYADETFDHNKMRQIRISFKTLPDNIIWLLAIPKHTAMEIGMYRAELENGKTPQELGLIS